jgi:lipopolysaccharide transport system permease protein
MAQNVINSRELIWQLFKRDFLAGYKKSFIGFSWIFISPVIAIISWVFLQRTGLLQPGDVGIPYPAYVLIGSSVWALFMGFFTSSSQTLTAGSSFIMQVNYPHEALLFKQVAQELANFSISFGLNIVVLLVYGVALNWKMILFPLVMLPLFFIGASIGLMVSIISAVAFDVSKAINMLMGLLIYITPVIYSDKVSNPLARAIITWNPLTYLVCSARDIIIYGRLYEPKGYAICTGLSLLLFLLSWRLFYISENKLIERMV